MPAHKTEVAAINEVVARRLRERREELGLSQDALGTRIAGFSSWEPGKLEVSRIEKQTRSVKVAELVLLAFALDSQVIDLLRPRREEADSSHWFAWVVEDRAAAAFFDAGFGPLQEQVDEMRREAAALLGSSEPISIDDVDRFRDLIDRIEEETLAAERHLDNIKQNAADLRWEVTTLAIEQSTGVRPPDPTGEDPPQLRTGDNE